MSVLSGSRRRFLGQVAGVGFLGSLAGCTAVRAVEVNIVIENTGPREERTEYYLDQEETTTEAQIIDLEPGEIHTGSVEMKLLDTVVILKEGTGFELTLASYLCRNPTIPVDTGFAMLAVGGKCFTTKSHPQQTNTTDF